MLMFPALPICSCCFHDALFLEFLKRPKRAASRGAASASLARYSNYRQNHAKLFHIRNSSNTKSSASPTDDGRSALIFIQTPVICMYLCTYSNSPTTVRLFVVGEQELSSFFMSFIVSICGITQKFSRQLFCVANLNNHALDRWLHTDDQHLWSIFMSSAAILALSVAFIILVYLNSIFKDI